MTSPSDTTVATTVRFRRWRTRDRWTCDTCSAQVTDPARHASWHASLNGTPLPPPAPGRWSEGGHYLTIHVDQRGQATVTHPQENPASPLTMTWDPLESTCRHASLSIL